MKKLTQEKVIAKSKFPIVQSMIEEGIKSLGIKKGDIVLVHSSLSSFGYVVGAEVTVVRALLNVVGETGTIVMPAQSSENTDPTEWENPPVPKEWWNIIKENTPAYDKNLFNTRGMGKIVNLLLQHKKSVRSNHPIVSFVAVGKKADKICRRHDLQPMFGKNTPLGMMYNMSAKVLMLGTDYDTTTCFHLSEVISNKLPTNSIGTKIIKNNHEEWIKFIDFDYNNDDFQLLGKTMDKESFVNKQEIGIALCRSFDLKSGVDYATRWMIRNRG